MSLTCELCQQRYALVDPQRTVTGERKFMCIACASQQPVTPRRFPEGTQRTGLVTDEVDRAERERAEQAHQLELAQGKVSVLVLMLQRILDGFPELRCGLTSAVQQQVLRDARAVLEECK